MLAALDTSATAPPRPGLRVSASPVQPKEAIDFFGKKTPLSKEQWEGLSEDARKRAFTAAWVTDVTVLQSVKDSLDRAIAEGESFESWKKRIRAELGSRWRRGDTYLETVFRNNVQSAYAAGRYQAATQPVIARMRPFWRLVVLLDDRTSSYCKPLANPPVILPAEDPWWATNHPPRHHRCRSTTVTLSRRQAERLGVMKAAPAQSAQDGWGSTAGLGAWQPSGDGIDPALFRAAEKTAAAEPPKEPVPVPEVRAAAPLAPDTLRRRGIAAGDAADLKRAARKIFGTQPPDIDELQSAYSAAGINARIRSVRADDETIYVPAEERRPTIRVEFNLVDRDGRVVGDMIREFQRSKREGLLVKHSFVELKPEARGGGYAEQIMRQSIAYYGAVGVKKVTLDAQYSGRYVWARLGFDWDERQASRVQPKLEAYLRERGMSEAEAERVARESSRHPWLVADITYEGAKVGKDFLLSQPGWSGALDLSGGPGHEQAKKRLKL